MNSKILNYILSLAGVLVIIHYFFSLYLLEVYLGKYKLNTMSIISWEDIQFYFALLDFYVFRNVVVASLAFIIIFFMINIQSKRSIGFKGQKYKLNKSQSSFRELTLKKRVLLILSVIFFFFLFGYFLYSLSYGNLRVLTFVLIVFAGATLLYYKYRKMDIIILGVIFVIIASIYGQLTKEKAVLHSNDIKLELENGEFVESDSINKLVFLGTKYVVIENDSPNVKLYPTDRIKEIYWTKKK